MQDFNPIHHHNGDFSAAIYLKVLKGMTEEWDEDFKDHYPKGTYRIYIW